MGLDAWRAVLLLGGPIVHATGFVSELDHQSGPFWYLVPWTSHLFRMQAFFFISGIVSGVASGKREHWFRFRLAQLGVPLVSTWLLLMLPLAAFQNDHMGKAIPYTDSQHLWFLIVLIAATAAATVLRAPIAALAKTIDRWPLHRALGFWIVAAMLLAASTSIITSAMPEHQFRAALITNLYRYSGFYFTGLLLSQCPTLIGRVQATRLWVVGPAALLAIIALYYAYASGAIDLGAGLTSAMVIEGSVALASVPMCLCITHTALRIGHVPATMWYFSRASFTVYLLHAPIIPLFEALPHARALNPFVLFAMTSAGSLAFSMATHQLLARYPWFRFLFNGRMEGRMRRLFEPRPDLKAS